jgi:hypothetical protein
MLALQVYPFEQLRRCSRMRGSLLVPTIAEARAMTCKGDDSGSVGDPRSPRTSQAALSCPAGRPGGRRPRLPRDGLAVPVTPLAARRPHATWVITCVLGKTRSQWMCPSTRTGVLSEQKIRERIRVILCGWSHFCPCDGGGPELSGVFGGSPGLAFNAAAQAAKVRAFVHGPWVGAPSQAWFRWLGSEAPGHTLCLKPVRPSLYQPVRSRPVRAGSNDREGMGRAAALSYPFALTVRVCQVGGSALTLAGWLDCRVTWGVLSINRPSEPIRTKYV